MISLKLALKNLIGAGLRSVLNIFILSVAFVLIILQNGMIQGWNKQATRDLIEWEYGQGQYWAGSYDPYDPFTYEEAHAIIPGALSEARAEGLIAPVLVSQATVYPEGRLKSIMLKGIDMNQKMFPIPTDRLNGTQDEINAVVGSRMASSLGLNEGDYLMIRWRDANGMFDAIEVKISSIFHADVPSVDLDQVWISLENLQQMLDLGDEATLIAVEEESLANLELAGWNFQSQEVLLSDLLQIIQSKSVSNAILSLILLSIALLAIFDTQVLSIFRRQKEIGTFIALGMTRRQVIGVFTVEGTMHAIMAFILGAAWGTPMLLWFKKTGFPMPEGYDQMGLPISDSIIPAYSLGLILISVAVVTLTTAIVSYMPARKIAKMNPNDAIRGKIQ